MISAASIREQKVVQSADTTPLSQRYGYKTAATVEQLRAAKTFVEELVGVLETTVDNHFIRLRDIGENPYRERILTSAQHYSNEGVDHGTQVHILDTKDLEKLHAQAFRKEGEADTVPDVTTLFNTAIEDLKALYRKGGFEVMGPYRRDDQGNFLVLRDPEYVRAREAFVEVKRANVDGALADRKLFRRLLLALRIKKPYQPVALPAPGPTAPLALPAPAAAAPIAAPAVAPAPQKVAEAAASVAVAADGSEPVVVAGQPVIPVVQAGGFSIAQ